MKFESISKIEINGKDQDFRKTKEKNYFMKFWNWILQLTIRKGITHIDLLSTWGALMWTSLFVGVLK